MKQSLLMVAVLGGLSMLSACNRDTLGSAKGTAAGAQWSIPSRWTAGGEKPFRAATYTIPKATSDTEGAECAVFYFGRDQGGDINANIERWQNQFENANPPARSTKNVHGMDVTLVQIAGTYLAPAGMMMAPTGKKENFRLLGAIVPAPQGLVFFKLTGPAQTVGAAESEFNALVESLAK